MGALGLGFLGGQLPAVARPALASTGGGADNYGPLEPPDANGLMLPPGFSSRLVAVADTLPCPGATSFWHRHPDGGAVFPTPSGGWVYVSNSERSFGGGGVGALEFDASGEIVDCYEILGGTSRNCAGGPTPWGTWLSCEEFGGGRVYECDPLAPGSQGILRPALGTFSHEAAAVDPSDGRAYLTEDRSDGRFYRFTPATVGSLDAGDLHALEILDPHGYGDIVPGEKRPVVWHPIPDPNRIFGVSTRYQAPASTPFDRSEGCWYDDETIYFATTGDHRVWALDLKDQEISILYDLATSPLPLLSGPDNVFAAPSGDVYVTEDGGNLEIVALTETGNVVPFVRITGQFGTEVTGAALNPDGTRLYFSSQRGPAVFGNHGRTYEVSGPFLTATPPRVPALDGFFSLALAAAIGFAGRRAARRDDAGTREG